MAASRDWICVRLATYENQAEADVLQSFFGRRTLPNTTFVMLAPDGKTRLSGTHRGPGGVVGKNAGDSAFAAELTASAKKYKSKGKPQTLPQALDFRRALNVASCDSQPLLVVVGPENAARKRAVQQVARLAWDKRFVGRLQYIVTNDTKQLQAIGYDDAKPGILLVEPGTFGISGRVREALPLASTGSALANKVGAFLEAFRPPGKDHRSHVRAGKREGVKWQTEIKQTDGPAYRREQRESTDKP